MFPKYVKKSFIEFFSKSIVTRCFIILKRLKVAPYSFMTARALMVRAVVICALLHKILHFS